MATVSGPVQGNAQHTSFSHLEGLAKPKELSLEEKVNVLIAENQALKNEIAGNRTKEIEQKSQIVSLGAKLKDEGCLCTKICNYFRSFTLAGYCQVQLPLLTKEQVANLIKTIKEHIPCNEQIVWRGPTSECGYTEECDTVIKVEREKGLKKLTQLLQKHLAGEYNCLSPFTGLTEEKLKKLIYDYMDFGNEKPYWTKFHR